MRAEEVVIALGRAALEGGVLMAMVWAACRAWPRLPSASRAVLWWLACARLLVGLLPLAPLAVAVLPTWAPEPRPNPPAMFSAVPTRTAVPMPSAVPARPTVSGRSAVPTLRSLPGAVGLPALDGEWAATSPAAAPDWRWPPPRTVLPVAALVLVVLWLAGASLRLLGMLRQLARARRAWRDAHPVRVESTGVDWARGIELAISDRIRVPLATGLLRPRILIPARMLARDERDLRLALAHERAHIRRGDLWMAWVPSAAEVLFWFLPLVALAVREYVQACEEACDEDTLRETGASPYVYGRLLLALGVERPLVRAAAIPMGSPHVAQLRRRLSMLQLTVSRSRTARVLGAVAVVMLAALALMPVHLVPTAAEARSPRAATPAPAEVTPLPDTDPEAIEAEETARAAAAPHARASSTCTAAEKACSAAAAECAATARKVARAARATAPRVARGTRTVTIWDFDDLPPVAPIAPIAPITPIAPVAPVAPIAAAAPIAPITPIAPVAPVAPVAPITARAPGYAYGYRSGSEDGKPSEFAYVLVQGEDQLSGSGGTADWREVQRLRGTLDGDFLWARVGRRHYVIQDRETLEQVEAVFGPQRELGEHQSRLGDQQSALGDRQSQLGDRQSELGDRQAELGEEQARIAEELARTSDRAERREFEQKLAELRAAMEELSERKHELGRMQESLGRQQQGLGQRQEVLSREMARRSPQMQRQLKATIEEAIRDGRARRLP